MSRWIFILILFPSLLLGCGGGDFENLLRISQFGEEGGLVSGTEPAVFGLIGTRAASEHFIIDPKEEGEISKGKQFILETQ